LAVTSSERGSRSALEFPALKTFAVIMLLRCRYAALGVKSWPAVPASLLCGPGGSRSRSTGVPGDFTGAWRDGQNGMGSAAEYLGMALVIQVASPESPRRFMSGRRYHLEFPRGPFGPFRSSKSVMFDSMRLQLGVEQSASCTVNVRSQRHSPSRRTRPLGRITRGALESSAGCERRQRRRHHGRNEGRNAATPAGGVDRRARRWPPAFHRFGAVMLMTTPWWLDR
jgi:hypothetical protein